MSGKHKIIHDTGRFNISEYRDYQYFHHWSGHSIAVLPYVPPGVALQNDSMQRVPGRLLTGQHEGFVALRKEDLPCWQADQVGADRLEWTCITGGCENDEKAESAMYRELSEELGLRPSDSQYIRSAAMRCGKGGNLRVTHFVLTVWSGTINDIKPDSKFEASAENIWLPVNMIPSHFSDFDLHTSHMLRMANLDKGQQVVPERLVGMPRASCWHASRLSRYEVHNR